LRCYLAWCAERGLGPFLARRPHLELYIRWMQEIRRFKPSTVSRRFSVTAGFYRTCVIDGVLERSPAEYVRRPALPAESPTLGFTHLQFEALLTGARQSSNRNDFALVAMLGLLGLRIFEATGADIGDLGEEHAHRVLRVCGKGGKVVLVPLPRQSAGPSTAPSAAGAPGRCCSTAAARGWTATPPPAGSDGLPEQRESGSPGHILICSGTPSSRPCSTPA
jgi:site-specific recombinase XerD